MSHDIYYFTGTGNSLAIARRLAEKTGARLLPVSKSVRDETISGATIGVVFPIYMYNAPRMVYEFLKKLRSCEYLYIVMTMGGGSGKAAHRVANVVAANKIKLSSAFSVKMPDNYIVWNEAADDGKQQELFAAANARVDEIAAVIAARKTHFDDERTWKDNGINTTPFPFNILPAWVIQLFFDTGFRFINRLDASFNLNGKCIGCGICVKVCPADNISMTDKKPTWQHKCEQCFACLQWCPQEAIEYGKKTIGKKRYTHPEVTVKEMMGQGLSAGPASGPSTLPA